MDKINYINERIMKEICLDTIQSLSDDSLSDDYKKSKSVKTKISQFRNLFKRHELDDSKIEDLLNDLTLDIVPAGTKGVVKGNKFNCIVKKTILEFELDKDIFEIEFEKQSSEFHFSEIPDWYILHKESKKLLIGMNQVDLWGGGAQTNRGSKYLKFKFDSPQIKLVCIVCNHIQLKNTKSKVFQLFEIGYTNDTLCYINGMRSIIDKFFGL